MENTIQKSANTNDISTIQNSATTIPNSISEIYGLQAGDLLRWEVEGDKVRVTPMRAELITPNVVAELEQARAKRAARHLQQ